MCKPNGGDNNALQRFNKPRAIQWMQRYAIDAIVTTSPTNTTYLTGYRNWLAPQFKKYMMNPGDTSAINPGFAAFVPDGDPALIISAILAGEAADLDIGQLYCVGERFALQETLKLNKENFDTGAYARYRRGTGEFSSEVAALAAALHDLGAESGRIAIDTEGLDPITFAEVRKTLPKAQFLDGSNLLRMIRMVKTDVEIATLATATRWGEEAAKEALRLAEPGRDIQDIVQAFRSAIGQHGGDFDHFAFTIGGETIVTQAHYKLLEQDRLFIDFGCLCQGYISDSGTTLCMSDPTKGDLAYFDAVKDSIEAGVEVMKPGIRASAVHHAMVDVLDAHGINGMFPHGHGLGLDIREYPILVPDNDLRIKDDCVDLSSDLELEPGMVVNLESCAFVRSYGAYQNEQTFVITPTGVDQIVPQDRERPVLVTG